MAGLDRRIDPDTGDYVFDGDIGAWETTRDASTAIYHQVRGQLEGWAGDSAAGSRFHELDRAKSSLRTVAVLEDILRECLAPLVAAGRITEPEIVVERDSDRSPDRIAAETSVRDLTTGEDLGLVDLIPLDL